MELNVGIRGFKQGTRINEIKVPARLRERYLTSVKWFDEAMGGEGLVPTSAVMITGDPGAGKSTLARQIADSVTEAGHICLYNTGEESLYQVSMKVETMKLKGNFICGQDTMISKMLEHADNIRKANPNKQLFLVQDSLQTLNDGKYADGAITNGTIKRCAEMLVDYAQTKFACVLVVGQVTKDGKFAGPNVVKHAFDGHAEIYFDEDKKSDTWGERLFEVSKWRWGCSGKTYIVSMGKGGTLHEKGHFSRVREDQSET